MNDCQYGTQTPGRNLWDSRVMNDQIRACNSAYTSPDVIWGKGHNCVLSQSILFVITALVVTTPTAHAIYIAVIAVYANFASVCGTSSSPHLPYRAYTRKLYKEPFFLYLHFFIGFGTALRVGPNVLYH